MNKSAKIKKEKAISMVSILSITLSLINLLLFTRQQRNEKRAAESHESKTAATKKIPIYIGGELIDEIVYEKSC